jgi:hypothetical protein
MLQRFTANVDAALAAAILAATLPPVDAFSSEEGHIAYSYGSIGISPDWRP